MIRRTDLFAFALAAALATPALAQQSGAAPANAPAVAPVAPAPAAGKAATTNAATEAPRVRADPTAPPSRSTATTAPPAGRRLSEGNASTGANTATPPRADALAPGSGAGSLGSNLPAMGGVTPNRAELAASAFTKLDGAKRGYLTLEDTRQLEGFESAFRQADQNGDGRLNPSEFNAAWALFTGNVR